MLFDFKEISNNWKGDNMFRHLYQDGSTKVPAQKEGDLYKIVKVRGKEFPIYYGFYEAYERDNPYMEPIPIYPDFLKEPQYTDDGFAYVTKMQDACKHYDGKLERERDCAECKYFFHGEELLGVCTCIKNKSNGLKEEE